ncbi:plasma membrane calcium [Chytriomyces hyalinus]|nr:plasma membrane calcium [Chytriomyces hyalinus]
MSDAKPNVGTVPATDPADPAHGETMIGMNVLNDVKLSVPDMPLAPVAPVQRSSKFAADVADLTAMVSPSKDIAQLAQLGGPQGILAALLTDENTGLSADNLEDLKARETAFGPNRLPSIPPKSIFYFITRAFKDKIIILLSVVAAVSLGIGIYEDATTSNPAERIHWIEGFSVLMAVIIIVLVSSINDLQKERQFRKLNAKKEDRKVKGVRDGRTQLLSIYDIVVGDILLLEPGDVITADGIIVSSMGLKCDESSATGESDTIKKGPSHDQFILSGSKVTEGIGKYVVTGVGEHSFFGKIMMAMRTENEDTPLQIKLATLAERIAKLGSAIAILIFVVLFLKYIILVLTSNGFGSSTEAQESGAEVATKIVKILLTSIAIVAVSIPEGLPLAVTLSLGYAATRMMKDNNLVRVLSACETMGNATTICSDKTGTLTQNRMTVVAGVVGKNVIFEGDAEANELRAKIAALANNTDATTFDGEKKQGPVAKDLLEIVMEGVALNSSAFEGKDEQTGNIEIIGSKTEVALLEWSTKAGFDYKGIRKGEVLIAGEKVSVVQTFPFSSERKSMATLVKVEKLDGSIAYRVHAKGAPEIVMGYCDRVVLLPFSPSPAAIHRQQADKSSTSRRSPDAVPAVGSRSNPQASIIYPLEAKLQKDYKDIIESFAVQSLRTILLAYKEIPAEQFEKLINVTMKEKILASKGGNNNTEKKPMPSTADLHASSSMLLIPNQGDGETKSFVDSQLSEDDDEVLTEADILTHPLTFTELVANGLIASSVVGIEDPLRPGVIEAVKACKDAGVLVRMVTGDNIVTARSIASKCGIYHSNGLVMEGQDFRKMTEEQMLETIPRLQVLARSSPLDKQILVSKLKQLGETVAVTGDGTNDGPALKMADIGFSMGIAGTEVAKEASSIILMDDSFSSVVKAILWGRSVNDSVKKFLQFQLSVNVSAVTITFVSALADSNESSALSVVQLLWVNLIMDTFAALALATELPTNELLQRPPESKKAPLISFAMWKMILGQAFLQIAVNLILLFAGPQFLGFKELVAAGGINGANTTNPIVVHQKEVLKSIIFNSFVMLQLFSLVNSRRKDSNIQVLSGIIRNPPFYCIFIGIAAAQAVIVEFGGIAFQTVHLTALQWLVCIIAGSLTLPWGVVIRLIPNDFFKSLGFKVYEETPLHDLGNAENGGASGDSGNGGVFEYIRRKRTEKRAAQRSSS